MQLKPFRHRVSNWFEFQSSNGPWWFQGVKTLHLIRCYRLFSLWLGWRTSFHAIGIPSFQFDRRICFVRPRLNFIELSKKDYQQKSRAGFVSIIFHIWMRWRMPRFRRLWQKSTTWGFITTWITKRGGGRLKDVPDRGRVMTLMNVYQLDRKHKACDTSWVYPTELAHTQQKDWRDELKRRRFVRNTLVAMPSLECYFRGGCNPRLITRTLDFLPPFPICLFFPWHILFPWFFFLLFQKVLTAR